MRYYIVLTSCDWSDDDRDLIDSVKECKGANNKRMYTERTAIEIVRNKAREEEHEIWGRNLF